MNLAKFVTNAVKEKISAIPELASADMSNISIEVPKSREFGDFSTNAAMILARSVSQSPRAIAEIILPYLSGLDFVANASIAGPGFLNIRLRDDFIASCANNFSFEKTDNPMIIDMDYGAYNIAKSLHIGHLRPSIVGDTLYRILKFFGHRPISYNHIGDWGRPMALVIAWIEKLHPDWPFFQKDFNPNMDLSKYTFSLDELNTYYPASTELAKEDPEYLAHVRQIKAAFQDGHSGYTALYNIFFKISFDDVKHVMRRLNMLPFDNDLGEKNAAKYLPAVEKILRDKNLIQKDDGAEIVVVKRDDDNAPMPPFMFYDSYGADTYDSTDLAALYYRKITDRPDRLLYLTDVRQKLHFEQLFRVAEMAGIVQMNELEHQWFGKITGSDGKVFKTRDGAAPDLHNIIDLVVNAVHARVAESGKNLPGETVNKIALAALKFNDLIHDIKSDYIFDADSVTAFEGRTGPYVLYTAVRLNSILMRAEKDPRDIGEIGMEFDASTRDLLISLLDFNRVIERAANTRAPDVLANYVYDLSQSINTFYHNSPILRDDVSENVRNQRLNLVALSLKILSTAIDLMGLEVPKEM